jgi:sec-independent protein translocase protein TatA
MPDIGAPELLIIALVVLLLFGASRLPKLGRSMGQSISGFKKGLKEGAPDDEPVQRIEATTDDKDQATTA